MALETSAEAPVPVRTVLQAVGGWIGKLGRIWVEGQIAEFKKRGNTVFLTLRDPIAAVSAQSRISPGPAAVCSLLAVLTASPTTRKSSPGGTTTMTSPVHIPHLASSLTW